MAIVIKHKVNVELHLKSVAGQCHRPSCLAVKVKTQVEFAEHAMANNDPILPLVRRLSSGSDREKLREKEAQVATLLNITELKSLPRGDFIRLMRTSPTYPWLTILRKIKNITIVRNIRSSELLNYYRFMV